MVMYKKSEFKKEKKNYIEEKSYIMVKDLA